MCIAICNCNFMDNLSMLHPYHTRNWREMIPLGEEMEYVIMGIPIKLFKLGGLNSGEEDRAYILNLFITANESALCETGQHMYGHTCIRLYKHLIEHLEKFGSFTAQGKAIFDIADRCVTVSKNEDARFYYQKLRDLGTELGCFTMEYMACIGLGEQALLQGFQEDGFDLLRNAVVATSLLAPGHDQRSHEFISSQALTNALFDVNKIDEAETLVLRMVLLEKDMQCAGVEKIQVRNTLYMIRLHEARGRPKEAESEVRNLFNLLNPKYLGSLGKRCDELIPMLGTATKYLKILHPVTGDKRHSASMQRMIKYSIRLASGDKPEFLIDPSSQIGAGWISIDPSSQFGAGWISVYAVYAVFVVCAVCVVWVVWAVCK